MRAVNMEKYYEIAGIPICISADREIMYSDDRELAPFRTGENANALKYSFAVEPNLAAPYGNKVYHASDLAVFSDGMEELRYTGAVCNRPENGYMMAHYANGGVSVTLNGEEISRVTVRCVLNAIAMEHLAVSNGGVILHCAYIIHNGRALLFTAPSGGGKSTQAELWRAQLGAEIINGDRAIIVPGEASAAVHSLPYAGSSGICKNKSVQLAAIVYLKKAEYNRVERLHGHTAFRFVWEGCCVNTWDRRDVEAAVDAVTGVLKNTPVFLLECTPEKSAVEVLQKNLEGIEERYGKKTD